MLKKLSVLTSILFFFLFSAQAQQLVDSSLTVHPKREFRGVWVATVENIDWPATPTETTAQQQQELLAILNAHQKTGINAIMFQVRPAADAFYPKAASPGQNGLPVNKARRPIRFMIPWNLQLPKPINVVWNYMPG